ncbi:MAG: hypothetical protein HY020_11145 [Burkholderiales bacterium]|nr:hypothetical protein [Burkholderiales bacterium]
MRTPAELLREAGDGEAVPLTRLAKRLDARVSELLREFTALGDATIGGVAGPGWVRLACDETGRWTVSLTEAGADRRRADPL